jgi:hypothetical protein
MPCPLAEAEATIEAPIVQYAVLAQDARADFLD